MIKYMQSKPSENNKKERIVTSVEKPTVYCTDIEELIAKTVRERDLNPDNIEIQEGMDDRQGLLKVMLTVKGKDLVEGERKRSKYSDGYGSHDFKYSSVKKSYINTSC